jgi:poly(glycerol-phosphate) alpha-glucosyltransferase
VVAYDIPYGPREQISDSVDGFVVPDRGIRDAADRTVALLTSPSLVAQMSVAARLKGQQHNEDAFVRAWAVVLNDVLERAPRRINRLTCDLSCRVHRGRGPSRPTRRQPSVVLAGRLQVHADGVGPSPATARMSLAAVDHATGGYLELPLQVERQDSTFVFSSSVDVSSALAAEPLLQHANLQLRLDWENAHWSDLVRSPAAAQRGDSNEPEVLLWLDARNLRKPGPLLWRRVLSSLRLRLPRKPLPFVRRQVDPKNPAPNHPGGSRRKRV